MACYLQWYSSGSLLQGHLFSAISLPLEILVVFWIVFKLRPNTAENQAPVVLQVLNSLDDYNGTSTIAAAENGNDSKKQILWANSSDCIRTFATAKLLQNASNFPPFHLSYADKYGHEEGQIGLDEIVTVKNAIAEGVDNVTSPISVEPLLQKNIDDVWHLPSKFDNFFDTILLDQYIGASSALGLSDWGVEDKIRMNRLRFFFASLMKSLKADGRVVVNSIAKKDMKKYVQLFKEAGYKLQQFITKKENIKLQLPFGILPNIYKEFPLEPVFTICASIDSTILERFSVRLENGNFDDNDNRSTMCAVNNANEYDKEEILLDQTQILFRYYFWVFVSLLCYFVVLVLAVKYWNNLLFPGNVGMPLYFCNNILSLLQGAPITFVIQFKLLYDNMTGLPRATSAKVNWLGFVYVVTAYIVATIQTLPLWIYNICFQYYFLQEVIGIPTTSVLSGIISAAFFFIMYRLIYKHLFTEKQEEKELKEEDFLVLDKGSAGNQSIVELTDVVSVSKPNETEDKVNENAAATATSNPMQH